ncbi:MAG: YbgA family protein [Syntrophobacteraceae bacterium]
MDKIRLGISSCLLGNAVRYDGGHQLDRFLRDTLSQYVDYVPVCPEAECGLGIPRETMRLEGEPGSVRLLTTRTKINHTKRMEEWSATRVVQLESEGLCGFVFKGGSPSSGMERVKLYDANGVPRKIGVGLFAAAFMKHFPLLPVEEDGRLHDPALRENFIERIFVYRRWRALVDDGKKIGPLVAFHTGHKLLVMAHSPKHYSEMGKLVARAKDVGRIELYDSYQSLLMEALKLRATPKKNTNVLQHLMGYFKKELSPDGKQELLEVIQQYHDGTVPLIVPITLIRHYVRKYDQPYLKDQVYLNPHPMELQLRNHV